MKKTRSIGLILCIILMFLLFFSLQAFATDSDSLDSEYINEIIASYETNYEFVSTDLYLYGTEVEISEEVDGNVFAYGSSVNVTGSIYGDLFVIANYLNISEDAVIYGNIFTCSTNITVSGIVSDIYAISSNFTLDSSGIIARNLYLLSDKVSLSGQISRDAYISTDSLSFGDSSEPIIEGNLIYTSETNFEISEDVVGGEIKYYAIETNYTSIILSAIYSMITTLLFSLVVILLSIWLAPEFKDRICEIISKKSFASFGIGILVFLLAIIISFALLVFTSGLGATIAVALIALLVLTYAISNTIFSMSISKLIVNKLNLNKTWTFVIFSLLGIIILELISYIPNVGGPITFITSLIGLGILCINAYKRKDLVNSKNNLEVK